MSPTPDPEHSRTAWDIDIAHSSVGFTVRHLVISSVHGRFDRWAGIVLVDEDHIERSRVEVRIEAASVNTHEPERDAHLRSADFFDTGKYPVITFQSTRFEKVAHERYRMLGDLFIAGILLPVSVAVEGLGRTRDPWGAERLVFSGKTSVDRRDYGLVWNQALETGGVLVGERVEIGLEIEAVRQVQSRSVRAA